MAHKLSVNAVETQHFHVQQDASVELPKCCTIRPFLVLRVALQSKQSIVMNVTASPAPFRSTLLRKPSKTPASSSSRLSFSVPMSIASLDARWGLRLQLHLCIASHIWSRFFTTETAKICNSHSVAFTAHYIHLHSYHSSRLMDGHIWA